MTAASTADLLPCPFCGSADLDVRFWASEWSAGPGCNSCGATSEDAEGWNLRAFRSPKTATGVAACVANLREQQTQLDADGVMVAVSRQALDETLALYDETLSALVDFRAAMSADIPCGPEYNTWLATARAARDRADIIIANTGAAK